MMENGSNLTRGDGQSGVGSSVEIAVEAGPHYSVFMVFLHFQKFQANKCSIYRLSRLYEGNRKP